MLMRLIAKNLKHKVTFRGCVSPDVPALIINFETWTLCWNVAVAERLAKTCVANDFRSFFLSLPKVTLSFIFCNECEHLGQQAKEFVFRLLWKSKFFEEEGESVSSLRLSVRANGMKGGLQCFLDAGTLGSRASGVTTNIGTLEVFQEIAFFYRVSNVC